MEKDLLYYIQEYHKTLYEKAYKEYEISRKARSIGYDPELDVEIVLTKNTAERVTGLLSVLFPDIDLSKITKDILSLEQKYGKNDLRVSMSLSENIAKNLSVNISDIRLRAEIAIRAGIAYLTQGVVTAPLEGISDVKIKNNYDGSKYLAIYYAGPIRSAGGTASAMSVVIADRVKDILGLDRYKPTEEEINRYFTEVEDYYTRVSPKQYRPTKQEISLIIQNVPVEITGEPTEKLEVSNYKDLDRVETNLIRGGMCLVLLDGLPLKAEKLLKFIKKYGKKYSLEHWLWLEEFINLKKSIHANTNQQNIKYIPSTKYLDKLVGGRPVLSFPGYKGGFRLRYGRSFTNGLASLNLSKGVFYLLDYLAMGTQVAIEAPGKAAVVMPNEFLENPIVKLSNGDVVEIKDDIDMKRHGKSIEKILYLGDVLIPVGEFISNNHVLLPAGYDELWWLQELKSKSPELYSYYKEWWVKIPSFKEAYTISLSHGIGLHPRYNLFWHDISKEDFLILIKYLKESEKEGNSLIISFTKEIKYILEELGVLHTVRDSVLYLDNYSWLYELLFSKYSYEEIVSFKDRFDDVMSYLQYITGIKIYKRAPTYLGLRMGRPEKAKHRAMKKGSPQLLFPVGEEGGRMRNLMETYNKGVIKAETVLYKCFDCNKRSLYKKCSYCGSLKTKQFFYCKDREILDKDECNEHKIKFYVKHEINVKELVDKAYERLNEKKMDLIKGVRGVFGPRKDVEVIEKGILRAKYGLYVYKDGTIRYDATDIPLTHFRPKDIGVSVDKLRELGYMYDIEGRPLKDEEQILLLLPQDIIIPDADQSSAAEYLLKSSWFIDDLLEKVYGLERYYNYTTKEDIIGTLVVGLAPHTSAGIVGRVIGFSKARGILAHPYWHAAKRRNADGDEDSIMLLLDAFINFSRWYLPDSRGARTMDAPLVLTILMNPEEVDDESWNIEVEREYSLQFYEKTLEYASPLDIEEILPRRAEHIIRDGNPYSFVYNVPHINLFDAPNVSRYVEVPDMFEKVKQQLTIAEKIRAVDENKIAEEILKKHFLKDMRGNLRQFSRQKFRCNKCNTVYRRVPLSVKCSECGGDIILTVNEGNIRKYSDIIKYIFNKYSISSYTLQTYELMEETIETMFGKKTSQKTLFG